MGREDEGSDLWEWETPRGLFLSCRRFLYVFCLASSQRLLLLDLYAISLVTKGKVQTHRHH